MKKLAKKRRLEIYKGALNDILENIDINGIYRLGMCHAISRYLYKKHEDDDEILLEPSPFFGGIREYYPELWRQRPGRHGIWWWSLHKEGTQRRIKALEKAIALIEKSGGSLNS